MQVAHLIFILTVAIDSIQVPSDPGLYFLNPQGLTRVEGRAVTISGTGMHHIPLKSSLPVGGARVSAQIIGENAEHKLISTPVFYYRVAPGGEGAGAGDLVLVRLKSKHGRRTFEVSEGEWKESAGISLRSQVQFYAKHVESGVYKLVPAHDLETGEYGFYQFRGHDLPGLIYDFSVE